MSLPAPRLLGCRPPSLGDTRLNRRLPRLLSSLAANPSAPVPEALATEAETEAFYRLVRNPRVEVSAMLEPHIVEVLETLPDRPLLVAHDSTNIVHATAEDADDVYALGSGLNGYVAHVSLAVDERSGRPLGVLHLETIDRCAKVNGEKGNKTTRKGEREHEGQRWARGAVGVEQRLGRREQSVVHVMDSEGDSFGTLQAMRQERLDFVVRSCQLARVVVTETEERTQLVDFLPTIEMATCREVPLSRRLLKVQTTGRKQGKRNKTDRKQRTAHLLIGAGKADMQRPHAAPKAWPDHLPLNLVRVWELDPPDDEEPVHWVLWTTLPVGTEEEILRVVDIYRRRWRIEEFFKALKTGCRFEKRRFESKATSTRALAMYLPIAALTLALRSAAVEESDCPASEILPQDHLLALQASAPRLSKRPTVQQALMAVARLGGHLRSNGDPGWLVLARGMEKLNERAAAWRLAREHYAGN